MFIDKSLKRLFTPSSLLLCRYLDQQVVSEHEVPKPSALNLDPQIGEEFLSLSEDVVICVLSVQVCL